MMKLFVALALSAAMPSAHAMGKYNSCEDSAQCVTNNDDLIPTDTCQEVREEKTTPAGTDVAVYPRWITLGPPNLGPLLGQMGPIDDPLVCWDECVAANPNDVIVQAVLNFGGCYCGAAPSVPIEFDGIMEPEVSTTTVFSCESGSGVVLPGSSGRKLETITRSSNPNWWKKQ